MAEEFKLPIDDTYMNVIKFGTGKRILIIISGISLCGLEGQSEAIASAYSMFSEEYCEAIASAYSMFSEEYTVYLFDRKKLLPSPYSVQDMAEDIYRALKMLDIHNADFFGVSHGGMMAMYLAAKYPSLVRKLVLCSTMCRTTEKMRIAAALWQKLAKANDVVSLNRSFFELVYSPAYLERFKDVLPELERIGTPADCERFFILVKSCSEFDVSDLMDSIQCPVLVLGDENDRTIGPEGAYEIAQRLNCDIYMYNAFSHAVYDEAPDIKQKVFSFLIKK